MSVSQYFVTLDGRAQEKAENCGGKFCGLVRCRKLLEKYNLQYGFNFKIPEAVAIKIDAYEDYHLAEREVPNELINEAMHYVAKLGGNVAVRSSADVEDIKGKTHSGEFASVLCVKNKAEMAAALNEVYASAQNVPGAKMGIVLQTMVNEPEMAGVVYSETVTGKPYIVFNYVENRLAEGLLAGRDTGVVFAASKYVFSPEGKKERLNLDNLDNPAYEKIFVSLSSGDEEKAAPEMLKEFRKQFVLAALINTIEEDLGYPVDVEFAIAKGGEINILQQRSYCLPVFYEKDIDKNTTVCFMPERPTADGEVTVLKRLEIAFTYFNNIVVYKDPKNEMINIYTKNSYITYLNSLRTVFGAVFYTHLGNLEREKSDFRQIKLQGPAIKSFDELKAGYYYFMKVDFEKAWWKYIQANNKDKILFPNREKYNLRRLINKYNETKGVDVGIFDDTFKAKIKGKACSRSWYDNDYVTMEVDNEIGFLAVDKYVFNPEGKKERLNLDNWDNPKYDKFFETERMGGIRKASAKDVQTYRGQFFLAALISTIEEDLGYPIAVNYAVSKEGKINIIACDSYYLSRSYSEDFNGTATTFTADKTIIEGEVMVLRKLEIGGSKKMKDIIVYKDKKNGVVRVYNKNSYLTERLLEGSQGCNDAFSEYFYQSREGYNFRRSDMDFCKVVTDNMNAFANIKDGDYLRIDLKSGQFEINPHDKCLPLIGKDKTR